jgi:hypothetical protein
VSRKRSKITKKVVIDSSSAVAPPCIAPLSTTGFDPSEWEIMYPCFDEEGPVDSPG